MTLSDTYIKNSARELSLHLGQGRAFHHGRTDRNNPIIILREFRQCPGHNLAVTGGIRRTDSLSGTWLMPCDRIRFSRLETFSLIRKHVNEHRATAFERTLKRPLKHRPIMAVNRSLILKTESRTKL
jgi:hypothetical protein